MKRLSILMLLAALLLVSPARAQIPPVLSYQGVLTDAGGEVVGDSQYNMTFRIYDVPGGGTALWTEYQLVTVAKGIFNVILGSDAALNLDFDTQYWLGIAVEAQPELTPRVPLTASAYSFSSMGVYGTANVFPSAGNVGIGISTPEYPLHVVADATRQVPIRAATANTSWASIYIEALDPGSRPGYGYIRNYSLVASHYVDPGGSWLLSVGGGTRMTVRSTGNTGIGVTNPLERLEIDGAVRIGASAGNYAGTIRFTGADFEGYDGATWKSLTAEAGSGLPSGSLGSTLRHNGSTWEAVQSLYNAGTNIGIGTTIPGAHLDVMGTATQKIKVETTSATGAAVLGLESTAGANDNFTLAKYGPSAAGTIAGISAANLSLAASGLDAGAMLVGTQAAQPLHFIAGGAEFMRLNYNTELEMFNIVGTRTFSSYADAYGHSLLLYDESGSRLTAQMQADGNGAGGYFALHSTDEPYSRGIFMDGNHAGLRIPRIDIIGDPQAIVFDLTETENDAVALPYSSISRTEILDEPGAASYAEGILSVTLTGSGTYDIIATRSLNAPDNGYVFVIGTMQARVTHSNGTSSTASFGVSDLSTGFPANQDVALAIPSAAASGTYDLPVTVHGLFSVAEGSNSFYVLGLESNGAFTVFDVQLTLIFMTTEYGLTDPTFAGAADVPDDEASPRVITAADADRERLASIEAENERIRRELDEMREQFERLRAEVSDNRQ